MKLFFTLFFFLFTFFYHSQTTIKSWLEINSDINESTHCIQRKTKKVPNYKKDTESKKEQIQRGLVKECVSQISKSIKFDKKHINDPLSHCYYEKKDKSLYCIVAVNKIPLSEKLLKILVNDLKNTDSKLQVSEGQAFTKADMVRSKVDQVKQSLRKNSKFKSNLINLNPDVDLDVVDRKIKSINSKINMLQTKYNDKAKTEDINRAKRLLNNNNYLAAYKAFLDLDLDYPSIDEITQGKEESKEKLQLQYDNRIEDYMSQKKYSAAVMAIDSLISVDIDFSREYRQKKFSINEDYFNQIVEKIETQLKYDEPSPKNLKEFLRQLKNVSYIDYDKYKEYKKESDAIILNFEIKEVKSLQYNKKIKEALMGVNKLKYNYDFYDKRIDKLENKLERKVSNLFKKSLLHERCSRISIEPSVTLMFPEIDVENIDQVKHNNANLMYSAGLYYRFKRDRKLNKSKPRFRYSQIGFKLDYLDVQERLLKDDNVNNYYYQSGYINPQISLTLRKFLQFDFGYVSYDSSVSSDEVPSPLNCNASMSFYLPFHLFSMGFTAKYITDFKQRNNLSLGYVLKINLGISKKYTSQDRNEIKTQMMKIKNQ